ncbi:MAG: hypothetical protein WCJ18_07905, partial [Planctomycetota bacterium]
MAVARVCLRSNLPHGVFALATAAGVLAACAPAARAEPGVAFEKKILTDTFHAEAAGIGDIDKDGHG